MDFADFSAFHAFIAVGAASLVISLLAALRDRMQQRRRNLDKIDIIAWGLVSVVFLILSIICFAAALHAR